jgi:ribosomal protein S6-L-glutamate ligase RimK-like protein
MPAERATILILGDEDDEHARHVLGQLQARGCDAVLIDSRWFPSSLTAWFDPSDGGAIGLPSGRRIAFDAVRSVYWRTYHGVSTPDLPDPEQGYIAHNDARALFESMLIRLPARWVNGWQAYQLHQTKPAQLAIIAQLGIPIPASLIGNDGDELVQFAGRHPRSIFKPVQGGAHTRALTPAHLTPDNLQSLTVAPVAIQEQVPGTNIRAFVAGEEVLACEVATEHLDYRDDEAPRLTTHRLPDEARLASLAAARALELVWTGIDWRLTPDGRYIFLEANPSPMFLGFEDGTGLPLTESLLRLLT